MLSWAEGVEPTKTRVVLGGPVLLKGFIEAGGTSITFASKSWEAPNSKSASSESKPPALVQHPRPLQPTACPRPQRRRNSG